MKPDKHLRRSPVTDLPGKLPGIDITEGLSRIGGNKDLFRKILFKFRENQGQIIEEIKAALDSGDTALAARLIHTLKGVAGNISANTLHQTAKELESAVKAGKEEMQQDLLSRVSDNLKHVLSGINALEKHQDGVQPGGSVIAESVNMAGVAALLGELKKYLEDDDTEAVRKLEQIKGALKGSALKDELTAMERFMEEYDFEKALEELKRMMKRWPGAENGPIAAD